MKKVDVDVENCVEHIPLMASVVSCYNDSTYPNMALIGCQLYDSHGVLSLA